MKQVAIDKNQIDVRKGADKNDEQIRVQKILQNPLAKDTPLNKTFKLVLRLSKVIPNIT